jgi:hypothetical protein
MPLHGRINDNWTDRPDWVTLAEKIKADNLAVAGFGYYSENRRIEGADALCRGSTAFSRMDCRSLLPIIITMNFGFSAASISRAACVAPGIIAD